MTTPYVTPEILINAPTGIGWDIIPYPQAIEQLQYEEQYNMCVRATSLVDGYLTNVVRATVDTEYASIPDYYGTIQQSTGLARLICKRWPVLHVLACSYAAAAIIPHQWTTLPTENAVPESPVIGLYGTSTPSSAADGSQAILINTGAAVNWNLGRNGYRLAISYINGWPHSSLTAAVTSGTQTVPVDDVTAFTGAAAFVYDGASTETVQVTSVTANANLVLPVSGISVPAGPGTLTLSAPLANDHAKGIVVSSIPGSIMWATILCAVVQALQSGIDAITIQNVPGSQTVGGHGVDALELDWRKILFPYRRTI